MQRAARREIGPRFSGYSSGDYHANMYRLDLEEGYYLIDPSLALPEEEGLPLAIFLTHGHYDHLAALPDYIHRARIAGRRLSIYLAQEEQVYLEQSRYNLADYFGQSWNLDLGELELKYYVPGQEQRLDEGWSFLPWHCPGHSLGSTCLLFCQAREPRLLVAGDMLFADSIGRTDLPGSNPEAMKRSLARLDQLLQSLPRALPVVSGHGADSQVGQQVETNPYLLWIRSADTETGDSGEAGC